MAPISRFSRARRLVIAAASGFILASCGETSVNAPLPVGTLAKVSQASLQGSAGQALPDPVEIQVNASDGQALPGATIAFTASNGGSVSPASATSDEDGIARTRWTLGTATGTNTLTATAESGVSTNVTATVTAAAPAAVAVSAGDHQSGPASAALPVAPSVAVTDQYGNKVEGATVSFTVLSGGGRVTAGIQTTDVLGIATVGSWVLGPTPGAQSLAARVESNGVSNNPVVFTATASTAVGSQMVATAGNNQHARVDHLVAVAPTVVVRDAGGNGVPGVTVTFAIGTGGGAVIGSRQITDASGLASVGGWFLGPLPGPNSLIASATGVQPVTFTATGDAGTPTAMVAVSATSQNGTAGTNVASPPSVAVRDAAGLGVAGVTVSFAVTAGGGSVVGSPTTTNASGIATLTSWKLGNVAGANTVVATSTGLPSVTFSATAGAGAAASVIAIAGNNQAAVQGTTVAVPPAVKVTDVNGNPVSGVAVTFAVTGGAGSATGLNQATDALGLATVGSWTLGNGSSNLLRATVTGTGITGNPVTFSAQSATKIAVASVPASPVNLGANFTITVQLQNSAGASVSLSGISLTISLASGGGALGGTLSQVTNVNGTASFTNLNVTGGGAGARTFTIIGAGLTSVTTAAITFQ